MFNKLKQGDPWEVGVVLMFVVWIGYAFFTDTTRESHPDHVPDRDNCHAIANGIKHDRLDEAAANPDLWRFAGYGSADAYAQASYNSTYYQCLN